jgi:hypothetical protein
MSTGIKTARESAKPMPSQAHLSLDRRTACFATVNGKTKGYLNIFFILCMIILERDRHDHRIQKTPALNLGGLPLREERGDDIFRASTKCFINIISFSQSALLRGSYHAAPLYRQGNSNSEKLPNFSEVT